MIIIMDEHLKKYLSANKIDYKIHEHPAVFTVKESKKIIKNKSYFHSKSLFLRDENKNFYLICMPAEKRLDMKNLKEELSLGELHFASPEELKKELNLTPGSVSIFGMIYAKNTFLIIDKELWNAESAGFHPNINTKTLEISHENLEKFYNSLKSKKEIMQLG
jgi:Ala-tRNA(Pro) deacylase